MNVLAIDIGGTAIKYAHMTQDMTIFIYKNNYIKDVRSISGWKMMQNVLQWQKQQLEV